MELSNVNQNMFLLSMIHFLVNASMPPNPTSCSISSTILLSSDSSTPKPNPHGRLPQHHQHPDPAPSARSRADPRRTWGRPINRTLERAFWHQWPAGSPPSPSSFGRSRSTAVPVVGEGGDFAWVWESTDDWELPFVGYGIAREQWSLCNTFSAAVPPRKYPMAKKPANRVLSRHGYGVVVIWSGS